MFDDYDEDDTTIYALTWESPEGPQYWSLRKGWIYDDRHAWTLSASEVDSIETEERLLSKLPAGKERRDGACWKPVYRRIVPYARGVSDDDEDNSFMETGE